MHELIVAIGFVFVIEGLCYALFPDSMKKMMKFAIEQQSGSIRIIGLIAAIIGLVIVYSIK